MLNYTNEMKQDLEHYLLIDYYKIIRIDLADDSYQIVLLQDGEVTPNTSTYNEYARDLVLRYIHPEDRELFEPEALNSKMRESFDGEAVNFIYRRKAGEEYARMQFIFIPDGRSDTTGYVFIKYAE